MREKHRNKLELIVFSNNKWLHFAQIFKKYITPHHGTPLKRVLRY